MKKILILIVFTYCYLSGNAQTDDILRTNTSASTLDILKHIISYGAEIKTIEAGYVSGGAGTFTYERDATSNLDLKNGMMMTSGKINSVAAPGTDWMGDQIGEVSGSNYPSFNTYKTALTTLINNWGGTNHTLYDVQYVRFTAKINCDKLHIQYSFASEEYEEWVGSIFNDAFAFFISGPDPAGGPDYDKVNIALAPSPPFIANTPVTINSINQNTNNQFQPPLYIPNQYAGTNIIFDGLTDASELDASIDIVSGATYEIVLIIGDASDAIYDSGIFLLGKGLGCKNENPCKVSQLTYTVGTCDPATGTYSITGNISYENPQGDISVEVDGVPFTTLTTSGSSIPYNLQGLFSDGLLHTVTFKFVNNPGCSQSFIAKAPSSCLPCGIGSITATPGLCDAQTNQYTLTGAINFTNAPEKGYVVISNGNQSISYKLPVASPLNYTIPNLRSFGSSHTLKVYFTEKPECVAQTSYTAPSACNSVDIPCSSCIASFEPKKSTLQESEYYIVGAWAKDEDATAFDHTFTDAEIYIDFALSGGGNHIEGPFKGKGEIIDGWQKIEERFQIPIDATSITVRLASAGGDVLFDDIRIFPTDGQMKGFVYDPISLRLVAELDENNYASFYEYDEEGQLTRVKKETERGIITVKEHRSHLSKQ